MKNIVLAAAALALLAGPALAVGPESFTVDVSRGYEVMTSSGQEQAPAHSNWAPRGQQASEEKPGNAKMTKASGQPGQPGKPHHRHHAKKGAPAAPGAAPAAAPAPAPAPAK